MDDEDFERPQISKRKIFTTFTVLLTCAYLATTIAANITFNSNNRVEFGQGVYNLKACDSFVGINLRSGSGANLDKVRYLDLSGFDKAKCKNKYFSIRLQKNGTNLNLINYQEPTPSGCGVTSLTNATIGVFSGKCVVKFTNNGSATLPSGVSTIDYLVIGGGGSGGNNRGGGGGAGAFVTASGVSISSRNLSATIGAGGNAVNSNGNSTSVGNDGGTSSLTFNSSTTVQAAGGGGGGSHNNNGGSAPEPGRSGGSGGGGSMNYGTAKPSGGSANNSSYGTSGYFGNAGGTSSSSSEPNRYTGGGGGSGSVGLGGSSGQRPNGGNGKLDLLGNYVAAGGGGADGRGVTGSSPFCETNYSSSGAGDGGSDGVGGRGELTCNNVSGQTARTATSGQANTGSGGGGGVSNTSGAGGSGVVQVSFTPPSTYASMDKVMLHVTNESNPNVFLVYTYGPNIGSDIDPAGDSYLILTYSNGVYSVEFLNPIVLVSDVTGTTFESADNFS